MTNWQLEDSGCYYLLRLIRSCDFLEYCPVNKAGHSSQSPCHVCKHTSWKEKRLNMVKVASQNAWLHIRSCPFNNYFLLLLIQRYPLLFPPIFILIHTYYLSYLATVSPCFPWLQYFELIDLHALSSSLLSSSVRKLSSIHCRIVISSFIVGKLNFPCSWR